MSLGISIHFGHEIKKVTEPTERKKNGNDITRNSSPTSTAMKRAEQKCMALANLLLNLHDIYTTALDSLTEILLR